MIALLLSLLSQGLAYTHYMIDLGSYFTKSVLVNNTIKPTIAENYQSKRLTPSFVAFKLDRNTDVSKTEYFKPQELKKARIGFGDQALSYMENRPYSGAGLMPLYLDMEKDKDEELQNFFGINKSITRVPYKDTLALYLKQYIQCISVHDPPSTVGIIVPATSTLHQRTELKDIIKRIGYKSSGIFDDYRTIADVYSIEKIKRFQDKPTNVLFIDVGATSIRAFVTEFAFEKKSSDPNSGGVRNKKLSYAISNNDGGAFLTTRIARKFAEKFNIKDTNNAQYRRIWAASEKIKMTLSLVNKTTQGVEDINDNDILISMTRAELEELTGSLTQEIARVIKEATNNITYDIVELIGGSSRIPIVNEAIKNATGFDVLGHSLNADEAYALGGAYSVQFRLGQSQYKTINTTEISATTVRIGVRGRINESDAGSFGAAGRILAEIPKGSPIPEYIEVQNLTDHFIISSIPEELPLPINRTTLTYVFRENQHEKARLYFKPDCPEVLSLQLCNESCVPVSFDLAPGSFESVSAIYHDVIRNEARSKNLGVAKSLLEKFAARIIEEVEANETIRMYTNSIQRAEIKQKANSIRGWLYGDGDDADEGAYRSKQAELRAAINPVYARIHKNESVTRVIAATSYAVTMAMQDAFLEWPINRTWIPRAEIDAFQDLLNRTMALSKEAMDKQRDAKPYEDNDLNVTELREAALKLISEQARINRIPRPPRTSKAAGFWDRFKKLWPFGKSKKNAKASASKGASKAKSSSTKNKTNTKTKKPSATSQAGKPKAEQTPAATPSPAQGGKQDL